ncbi:MAG: hypothetical protein K2L81_02125, partial [Muribaculaceae bacterium]|nr:hypothetical protein [Muribaculaceae bacterium]
MNADRKIIVIGELGIEIPVDSTGKPGDTRPGGRLLNIALNLAKDGIPVEMVGDMGSDPMGDLVMRYLTDNNVGVRSVDRYTDGLTPVTFDFGDRLVRYATTPADQLDVVWPRINPGDLVVFGGYYSLDERVRPRLLQLLSNAQEMKALLIYLPGFNPQLAPRITRVMPSLLENMEMASTLVTTTADLCQIYANEGNDPVRCYRDHIFYYAPRLVNIDQASGRIEVMGGT